MPEQTNPYADPMNPNGSASNYAQQGYFDGNNPYAQPGAYGQDIYGNPMGAPGYPGMPQEAYGEEFLSPENMQSAQDIYANQAAQMGMVPQNAYGSPYADPNMQFAGQDPYGNQGFDPNAQYGGQYPYGNPNAPYADPNAMPGGQMPYANLNDPYGNMGYGAPYQQDMYGNPIPGQYDQGQGGYGQDPSQMGYPYADPNAGMMGAEGGMSGMPGMQQGFPGQGQDAQAQQGQNQYGQMPAETAAQNAQSAQVAQAAQNAQNAQNAQAMAQQAIKDQIAKQQAEQALHENEQRKPKRAGRSSKQQAPAAVAGPAPVPINPALASGGKATLAFIFGILSIILALIPPLGIILAVIAIKISKKYVKNGGRSARADIGRVFGYVGLVFSIVMAGVVIWFIGYVFGTIIGTDAYMNPITYFNNSPLGAIIKVPA